MNDEFVAFTILCPIADVEWTTGTLVGKRGIAPCVDYHSDGVTCNRYLVTLDVNNLAHDPYGSGFNQQVGKTACHENGHTMGLSHYKSETLPNPPVPNEHDCMISGAVNGEGRWLVYATHHKNHINNDAF